MTDFDYQIELQRIYDSKYVHELESLVRKYVVSPYSLSNVCFSLLVTINQYKAITCALKQLRVKSNKSLPDFVHDSIRAMEKRITEFMLTEPMSYEQFIDCFQFKSGSIYCKSLHDSGYSILKAFALIVQDNPQPYTFDWNYNSKPLYRELIKSRLSYRIIELEHFKQQFNLVNNTIVETELLQLYMANEQSFDQINEAHQFVLQIDQVYQTIKSKL